MYDEKIETTRTATHQSPADQWRPINIAVPHPFSLARERIERRKSGTNAAASKYHIQSFGFIKMLTVERDKAAGD